MLAGSLRTVLVVLTCVFASLGCRVSPAHAQWLYPQFETLDCSATSSLVLQSPTLPPNPYRSMCTWGPLAPTFSDGFGPLFRRDGESGTTHPAGFRLNVNLVETHIPGDFVHPAPTLGGTSLPLVPPGAGGAPTSWGGTSRETLAGIADLVTGAPLVQTVDLELPFRGASFRLARTRSAIGFHQRPVHTRAVETDRWWDFNGGGWMIGENPLLLVDSAIPDVVGNSPVTCWLILDAFQSIPFQQIESSGRYEAPARFRARMEHNGTWTNRSWSIPPTQYKVTLYDGALTYTFNVHREDIPSHSWDRRTLDPAANPRWEQRSYHDRPFLPQQFPDGRYHNPWTDSTNPGFGVPYYATCSMIEDRYGHVVEMTYQPASWFFADHAGTPECIECAQNCPSKGQLRSLRLSTRREDGSLDVAWTLVYAHRLVSPPPKPVNNHDSDEWNRTLANSGVYGVVAIDRIYVYDFDATAELENSGFAFTLPPTDAMLLPDGTPSLDGGTDPLASASPASGLHAWRYCIRSHYNYTRSNEVPEQLGRVTCPPTLLKTTMTTADPVTGRHDTRTRAFIYSNLTINEGLGHSLPWLEAVFEPAELARLLAAANDDACADQGGVQPLLPPFGATPFSVNDLVEQRWEQVASCAVREPGSDRLLITASARSRLLAYATSHWQNSAPLDRLPDEQALVTLPGSRRHYVDVDSPSGVAKWTPGGTVRAASLRNDRGEWRHYRMYKYWLPPSGTVEGSSGVFGVLNATGAPHRSVFAAPYTWQGYALLERASLTQPGQQLATPRFITIVEEFDSQEARDNPQYGQSEHAANYSAPGLRTRTVVYLNASGLELKRREWAYEGGSFVTNASGVGEESVYQTAEQYFNTNTNPDDNIPTAGPGGYITRQQNPGDPQLLVMLPALADPFTSLRSTLLLVERRSIGWSLADIQNQGESRGLVDFFEHRRVDTVIPAAPGSGEQPATSYSSEQYAQGIAQGSPLFGSKQRYYTHQVFEREQAVWAGQPCELSASVTFTEPRSTLLASCPLPADSPDSWAGFVPTFRLTLRDANQADIPQHERRVLRTLSIGAPRRQRPLGTPGGELWFYPIEGTAFDDQGSQEWAVDGLVTNPLEPQPGDPLQSTTLTYYLRDGFGRALQTVLDAQPGTPLTPPSDTGGPFVVNPVCPWPRIADVAAHNYLTSFGYSHEGRLIDTYLPNGRRWASRVIVFTRDEQGRPMPRDRWYAREYIFSDLVPAHGVANMFFTESVAEIRDYFGPRPEGTPKSTMQVDMTGPFNLAFADETQRPLNYRERAVVRVAPDANGRITSAELLEPDDDGNLFAVGSKEVNDLVDLVREREIDGTITRTTRNRIGQPLRTYVGTQDDGWVSPTDLEGRPLAYDMILRSRTEYGTSINDIQLPTVVREYTSNPAWARDHHGQPPSNDTDGIATVTTYDWRGRAVRTDTYPRGPVTSASKRRQTTLTFLDFAGRPALEVTFAENTHNLPPSLDPSRLGPTDPIPGPALFLAMSPQPTSLATTHYSPDGSASERRAYDVASVVPNYVSTFTFLGRGGQAVLTHTVGSTASLGILDGVGRTRSTATIAPGRGNSAYTYELGRTDFRYDADGNIIETTRWERTASSGDVLDESNAVASRSHQWYDNAKRSVASLDLGTESGDVFTNTPAQNRWSREAGPFADPNVRPRIGCSDADPIIDPGALDDKMFDHCEDSGNLALLNTTGLADAGLFSINRYNKSGQLTHTREVSGDVTIQRYNPAGRLAAKIENAWGDPAQRRTTRFRYQLGRLVEMTASRDANESLTEHTHVVYGAAVVDDSFATVSRNNTLVGRLYLPHPITGLSRLEPRRSLEDDISGFASAPAITLKYTFSGQIAERVDARGIAFRYRYDDQSRLASIEVGHYRGLRAVTTFVPGHPSWMAPANATPQARVAYIEYDYDPRGNMTGVRAYDSRDRRRVLSHNRFDTDLRGNLLAEHQALGALVSAQTPAVRYHWTHIPANLQNPVAIEAAITRLAAIIYPAPHNGTPGPTVGRDIEFAYGEQGSLDAQLSRVTSLRSAGAEAAGFAYTGESRRARQTWGRDQNGAPQLISDLAPLTQAAGFAALDELGRRTNLAVANAAGIPQFAAAYRFDSAGNRTSAVITRSSAGGVPQINDASQLNTYDQLNRLISTQHGPVTLAPGGQASIDPAAIIREERWSLDLLGNWSGSGGGAGTTGPPGLERTGNLDQHGTLWARLTANSNADFERITHAVDRRNAITGIASERGTIGGAPVAHNTATVYDGAGNIVFDGELVYIYDAWARITEIRRGTLNASVPSPDPAADQPPNPYARVNVGELVKSHAYDGLGRLVTTTTPLPAAPGIAKRARTERFIYDGVRRVQEYVSESPQTPNASPTNRLEREYVWGPGDGIAGVDELLAQYDGAGRAWWVVQDGGGDIVALAASADPQHPYARVAAQWQYDAYGTVTAADHFLTHRPMHAGHKGLFLDRIDANTTGTTHDGDPIPDGFGGYTTTGTDPPRLAPYARTLYHVRNRNYAPHLGRWLQLDPNASGRDVLEASVYAGRGFHAASMAFGLEEMYGDGGSLFAYLGGAPLQGRDPAGLYSINEWWRDTREGAGVVLNGLGTATAGADAGGLIGAVLEAMIQNYSMNLEADLDWAGDWSQGDDWHSRTSAEWVDEAMLLGAYRHFNLDYWFEPEDAKPEGPAQAGVVQGVGKTVSQTAKALKKLRAGMVFKSYSMAKAVKAAKSLGSRWDAHHILPRAWARLLDLELNGPAVLITKAMHQPFTTELNNALRILKKTPEAQRKSKARQLLRKIYAKHPEWYKEIEPLIK